MIYVTGNPPRSPMSFVLSVKEGQIVETLFEEYKAKASFNEGDNSTVLSIERCFGGHVVLETGMVPASAPLQIWLDTLKRMAAQLSIRMREMQPEVTPDIAALLTVAGCSAMYLPSADCWNIEHADVRKRAASLFNGTALIRQIPTDADYEAWRAAITSLADQVANTPVASEAPAPATQAPQQGLLNLPNVTSVFAGAAQAGRGVLPLVPPPAAPAKKVTKKKP